MDQEVIRFLFNYIYLKELSYLKVGFSFCYDRKYFNEDYRNVYNP